MLVTANSRPCVQDYGFNGATIDRVGDQQERLAEVRSRPKMSAL